MTAAGTAERVRVTRAPSDVLRLVVAVALLVVACLLAWLFERTVVDNVASAASGLDTLSGTFLGAVALVAEVLGVALLGGGLIVVLARRQWLLALSAVVGAALAVLLSALLGNAFDTAVDVTRVDNSVTLFDPGGQISAAGLAALTACVTATAPWVSRRWRRWAWAVVLVLAGVRMATDAVSFETLLSLLAGWTAGAAAVVLFGAPTRRPTRQAVADGLAAVGVPLRKIEPLSVDARGSTPYLATALDGNALFVKSLGADERSADLLFRLYRSLHRRQLGDERPFSSLRRGVEHEALVALAARDFDVRTPRFVAFASAVPNGYVLAYEAIAGRSLDQLEAHEMTDDVLARVWEQLVLLRAHRVAHRDLRLANVFLADDGAAWIIDFGFSELAASDLLLANDLAELLASSSTRVGAERAVAAGVAAVGTDAVRSSLERLHPPMLSGATRTALKAAPGSLEVLRALIESASSSPTTRPPAGVRPEQPMETAP